MDFLIGGVAAMCAGLFSNPFDVIKTRQQLQGELKTLSKSTNTPYKGLLQSIRSVVKAEGILALQKGLGPALSFQFVLNSTRLGLYQTVENLNWTRHNFKPTNDHSPLLCIFWGGISGVFGSILGCPLYLIKTQIQARSVGKFAVGYQHDHKSTINGLINIYKSQGARGLWRGSSAMIPRTSVGSSVQLASFSNSKDFLLNYQVFRNSTFFTSTVASAISGFLTVVFMTPFDTIATRLFNQGVDKNGRGLLYKNIFDCFSKTYQIEGMRGLYKGFIPNYWRAAPHTMLNLTFWEQFKYWRTIYLPDDRHVVYLD